jgi:acetyl-CoA carboxylase/biotin carboxylase 1
MEAKGCAKPVVWKDARRVFYWAIRARVARSSALAKIAEANPDATYESRSKLLDSLACITPTTDHREAAAKLEQLDITKTVTQIKADGLVRNLLQMINQDRKAAMDGLARLVDNLTDEEKIALQTVLNESKHVPGASN